MSGSSRQLTLKKGAHGDLTGVRSAMRVASQLPGRGPSDMDDAPAPGHLHVNQKSYHDDEY